MHYWVNIFNVFNDFSEKVWAVLIRSILVYDGNVIIQNDGVQNDIPALTVLYRLIDFYL